MIKKYSEFLNLDATIATRLFESVQYPWDVFSMLDKYIVEISSCLGDDFIEYDKNVFIHKTAKISENACIVGPAIICKNVEIRHCAYIRGGVIIGENCVIGNATEVKNSVIFNNCQCPHYNYIGDSILGEAVHLGAGVVLSNFKMDHSEIVVHGNNCTIPTGIKKFGSVIGNYSEIGCNCVLFPGTIVGQNTFIYPLTRVYGEVLSNRIMKSEGNIICKEMRNV